jgi:hypothetical protein
VRSGARGPQVPGLRQALEREPTIGAVLRADLSIASLAGEPLICSELKARCIKLLQFARVFFWRRGRGRSPSAWREGSGKRGGLLVSRLAEAAPPCLAFAAGQGPRGLRHGTPDRSMETGQTYRPFPQTSEVLSCRQGIGGRKRFKATLKFLGLP